MRSEQVEVRRLDGVLEGDPAKSVSLKMDVQGFEKQVLEGAKDPLKRTNAIYVELPIAHLYEGLWTFAEAVAYMENLGFTPAQFRTLTALPHDRALATEFDCLIRRH